MASQLNWVNKVWLVCFVCVTSWLYHVVNSYPASHPFNLAGSLLDQSQWAGLTSWTTSEPTGWAQEGGERGPWGEHSKQTCTVYHGKACHDTGCDSGEADTTEVPVTAYCDSGLLSCSSTGELPPQLQSWWENSPEKKQKWKLFSLEGGGDGEVN